MNTSIPRVMAIHDLSGLGRVSLAVVIPILSTLGIQVVSLPTALLSASTVFEGNSFLDLTANMRAMLAHWKTIRTPFSAIYSGYLGSVEQIGIIQQAIDDFAHPDLVVVVDPVLGDNGRLYRSFGAEHVAQMRNLIGRAHIITPNLTEAKLLLNKMEHTAPPSQSTLQEWMRELAGMGPEIVIITSVPGETSKTTAVMAYERKEDRFWKVSCSYIPASYPGTGDSFTSVVLGAMLQGDSLPIALDRAVNFISLAIRSTFGHKHNPYDGIHLEKVLDSLKAPITVSTYELMS